MTYGTIAEADTYWTGNTEWLAQTDTQKQKNLDRSESYLDSLNWQGVLTDAAQTIAWPRTGVVDREDRPVDPDTIPDDITAAYFECAELDRTGELYTTAEAALTSKTVAAGSVSVSKSYSGSSNTAPVHGEYVDNLVDQYLENFSEYSLLRA